MKTDHVTKSGKLLTSTLCAATAFCALPQKADASVVVLFSEIGGNVEAMVTGNLDLSLVPLIVDGDDFGTSNTLRGSSVSLLALTTSQSDIYNGTSSITGLNTNPSSWSETQTTISSVSFGFIDSATTDGLLYVPGNTPLDDPNYVPIGTYTWNSNTIAGIGLGSLTTTPLLAFTLAGGGGETISYALVPEPSSGMLGMAGALLLLGFRKRR